MPKPAAATPPARPAYVGWVERARAGEDAAFRALVDAFQDMVVGTAFGWLRDIELAREVAQETFANAHAALGQLGDAAAFPGWLRRIVHKHCDRITRRGEVDRSAREPDAWPASDPGPEVRLAERRESERLRRAVEALPEGERLPLALHYFAGEPQPAVAAFLELPLSTVKKRLRSARARLRDRAGAKETPMSEPTSLRPSRDERFGDRVELHLALRSGDRPAVARILARSPALADAPQHWDPALAWGGVLPFATRATPLITAIERDDPAMVALLLEAGASPDGACGCATGEAPLWAAVLLGRPALAGLLLDAGADPNGVAATGNTPLHVAAMRGQEELARLLLARGADALRRDAGGRTPGDWARARGCASLAGLLPASAPLAAAPDARPALSPRLHETGVKALDLFAPLVPGALVRVPFRAGIGMVVLLAELSSRFAGRGQGAALWTGFAQGPYDPRDLRAELAEAGIADRVPSFVAPREEAPEARRAAFRDGVEHALALRDAGRDVLLVLLTEPGFELDVEASLPRLRGHAPRGSLVTLLVTPFAPRNEDGRGPLSAPFDARIHLDRRRARRRLFPALDPLGTRLRDPEGVLSERHRALADAARALAERYEALDPELALPDPSTLPDADVDTARRGQRLLRLLGQPFRTTEPFHGRPARHVALADTLAAVEAVLAGRDLPGRDDELPSVPAPAEV